jgi:DsbC/DsbD-like thiol-disulfide interchange protein
MLTIWVTIISMARVGGSDYAAVMSAPLHSCRAAVVCVGVSLSTLSGAPVYAQDASRWQSDTHSAVRLIAGAPPGAASVRRAGVEIKLAPGWKTYWRYPGDSGVPPRFDFTRSTNVQAATVLWPAPIRFPDGSGESIGYKGSVIFPVHVTPLDARKPVALRLKLDYAVCEKLCIPAEAESELVLAGAASAHESALATAEARVPRRAEIAAGGTLVIRSVRREAGGKPRVVVEVATPAGSGIDLFAEGPTAEWALPLPAPLAARADGVRPFAFELDGLPSGAKADGAVLTLTAVSDKDAIEVAARLD